MLNQFFNLTLGASKDFGTLMKENDELRGTSWFWRFFLRRNGSVFGLSDWTGIVLVLLGFCFWWVGFPVWISTSLATIGVFTLALGFFIKNCRGEGDD